MAHIKSAMNSIEMNRNVLEQRDVVREFLEHKPINGTRTKRTKQRDTEDGERERSMRTQLSTRDSDIVRTRERKKERDGSPKNKRTQEKMPKTNINNQAFDA